MIKIVYILLFRILTISMLTFRDFIELSPFFAVHMINWKTPQ